LVPKLGERQSAEAVVRDLAVVVGQPKLCLLAYFGQIPEDAHVKDATPDAAIKALE
jgi:hypothetical protein